jgi:hypothetical protein
MKLFILLFAISCTSAEIQKSLEGITSLSLQPDEMSLGLKEALSKGLERSVSTLSQKGAFSKSLLRISFPEEVKTVKDTLNGLGMKSLVDKTENLLNEAAENAVSSATPIFLNAIKGLTFSDAQKILAGADNEATLFLKSRTESELIKAFRPHVTKSLKEVKALSYWGDITSKYNAIPFTEKIETDLEGFVTAQAVDGLFIQIAKEEKEIRENPKARTTDILKKVFGRNL